jgi:cytochrome c oxidase subunit 2
VGGQEKAWLWLVVVTGVVLFAWMFGWMYAGAQNPTGDTYRTSPERFRQKMADYREEAAETDRGLRPAGEDVYVAGLRFAWDGLPVVLEAGKEYDLHLSTYDVQHGFSVRPEEDLWKQINLQAIPGYEWVVPMRFEEPGTYYVACNEFCGVGHRVMTAEFHVVE